jgi:hypothetical protein
MRANLLPSWRLVLSACLALGFAPRLAPADDSHRKPGATARADSSAASKIKVENWFEPRSGWLYVLDAQPDKAKGGGRILVVDPQTGNVMNSVRTGDNPDFALSPDGSRLYVASITEGNSSELAVVDTGNGEVLGRDLIEDREVGKALPAFSMMAVSGDGLMLRIVLDTPESADRDMFLLAAFDTQSGHFLRERVRLWNCGPGRFISYPTAHQFDILCPRSNRVRLIGGDEESHALENTDVTLPWERRIGAAHAIESRDGEEIAIVRGDGGVFAMNVATHEFAETSAHPVLPNRVPPAAWPVSPDGRRIYLGYNTSYNRLSDHRFYLDYGRPPNLRPNSETAQEFKVFDTDSWKKIGTIKTKAPFWSAAVSADGKTLYATVPQKHSILVIDTGKMRQTRELKVGGSPTLAIVAP